MTLTEENLVEDVELSFKLLEFSIRTMCYIELEKIDVNLFGQDLQINFERENVSFPEGEFISNKDIIHGSYMAVSTAFGSTAICLDSMLENDKTDKEEIKTLKKLIQAVRNAFSHGIASPRWYIKPHKCEILDLNFVQGPIIDLGKLNGQPFDYIQIGDLACWYRIKNYVIEHRV